MPTNNSKFLQLRKEISSLVYERTDEINGLLLALLTREHVILVGPPGTAKSLVIRLVRASIDKARLWEHLFTKFTMPEEVFGPVLCLQTFRSEAEAVALANSTEYGLAGTVWTSSRERAELVELRLRSRPASHEVKLA